MPPQLSAAERAQQAELRLLRSQRRQQLREEAEPDISDRRVGILRSREEPGEFYLVHPQNHLGYKPHGHDQWSFKDILHLGRVLPASRYTQKLRTDKDSMLQIRGCKHSGLLVGLAHLLRQARMQVRDMAAAEHEAEFDQ